MTPEEATDRSFAEVQAHLAKLSAKLLDTDVRRVLEEVEGRDGVRFHPARATIAAERFGPGIAMFPLTRPPATDASRDDLEAILSVPVRCTSCNGGKDTNQKINRQCSLHNLPATIPADSLNHLAFDLGTPHVSLRKAGALDPIHLNEYDKMVF